jgi:hypothetical protein
MPIFDVSEEQKIRAYAEMLAEGVEKPVTRDDVAAKTVPELKRMLRERLLKTTGNKAALMDRGGQRSSAQGCRCPGVLPPCAPDGDWMYPPVRRDGLR